MTETIPTGTVTFLFTDIASSTRLLDELGADVYGQLLTEHHAIVRTALEQFNGTEIDTQGDAFFASFLRASEAVAAVVQIQQRLAEHPWPEGVEVWVRMGLHTGEPWLIEEGYVGMAVHRAARIAHVGHGGQVLLSETTTPLVTGELSEGVTLLDLGRHRLKDMRRPEHIHQLVIAGLPSDFPPLTSLELIPTVTIGIDEVEARPPREVGESPYRGLAAFNEEDAQFFFGREAFTEQLLDSLHQQRLVAVVVGSSGSGKSSTVFAGVVPQLREQGDWLFISFRPGNHPFQALAAALIPYLESDLSETERLFASERLAGGLSAGEISLYRTLERVLQMHTDTNRVLLIADQFEELYTLVPDGELREVFLDEMLATVESSAERQMNPFVFLLTLRADFMGQALTHRPFADALQAGSLMLGPMNRDELQAAIEKPAEQQGAAFEAGLVTRILDDVGEEPGNLPLLEFTLTLLWDRMEQGWMTHAVYDEIGRVEGALSRFADEVYADLSPDQKEQARRTFVQLVQPGQGTEDTRRVAKRTDLVGVDWNLVQHLADQRLIVTSLDEAGDETVEVVHEALIRGWGQLRMWMDADREFRNWQEGLRAVRAAWENNDHDDGALLRGAPLAQAQEWLDSRSEDIGETEKNYILASAEFQAQRQRVRDRRRRLIIGGLAVGLVVAVVLSVFAFSQQRIASQNADRSQGIALALNAEKAFEAGQHELALALAMEANRLSSDEAQVQRILLDVAMAPGTRHVLEDHTGPITALAVSPDGRYLVSAAESGEDEQDRNDFAIRLWDLDTGEVVRKLAGHEAVVRTLDFSPDGQSAISGGDDNRLIWWDISSGEMRASHKMPGEAGTVSRLVYHSNDDTTMVVSTEMSSEADASTHMRLIELESGETLQEFDLAEIAPSDQVAQYVLSVDSAWYSLDQSTVTGLVGTRNTIGTLRDDFTLLVTWNIKSGERLRRLASNKFADYEPVSAVPTADENVLLIGSQFGPVAFIDIESGATIQELFSIVTEKETFAIALSPDNNRVVAGFFNGELCHWDVGLADDFLCIFGHEGAITSLEFTSDSQFGISGGADATIRVWDLNPGNEILSFHPDEVVSLWGIDVAATGQIAVSGAGAPRLDSYSEFQYLRSYFMPPIAQNHIIWWDTNSGEEFLRDSGHGHSVWGLEITEKNKYVISSARWEGFRILDLLSGDELFRFAGAISNHVTAFTLDPSETMLLFSTVDQRLSRLRLDDFKIDPILVSNTELEVFNSADDYITALAVSLNGQMVLVGTNLGKLLLLDLSTGAIIQEFFGHSFSVDKNFILPDGDRMLSLSKDLTARIWDIETGAEIHRFVLGETTDEVSVVADISPDGKLGMLGSNLWDLDTFEQLATIDHQALNDVAFSPDGQYIFTSSFDGTVRKWAVPPRSVDELKEWIEDNRYVPELAVDE